MVVLVYADYLLQTDLRAMAIALLFKLPLRNLSTAIVGFLLLVQITGGKYGVQCPV